MSFEHEQRPEWRPEVAPSGCDGLAPQRELAHGAVGRLSRDELAQQDICASLLASGLDAHHIEVEMTGEGLTLRGTVGTENDRSHALEIARGIARSRVVRDALTVSREVDVGVRLTSVPTAQGERHGPWRHPL
jgi:osmotically-inducible protein OsmY